MLDGMASVVSYLHPLSISNIIIIIIIEITQKLYELYFLNCRFTEPEEDDGNR